MVAAKAGCSFLSLPLAAGLELCQQLEFWPQSLPKGGQGWSRAGLRPYCHQCGFLCLTQLTPVHGHTRKLPHGQDVGICGLVGHQLQASFKKLKPMYDKSMFSFLNLKLQMIQCFSFSVMKLGSHGWVFSSSESVKYACQLGLCCGLAWTLGPAVPGASVSAVTNVHICPGWYHFDSHSHDLKKINNSSFTSWKVLEAATCKPHQCAFSVRSPGDQLLGQCNLK